MEEGNVEARHF